MNDILRFASLGKACPLCHNEMELKARWDLDGSCRGSIEWYCNKHSERKGKPVYDLIAALYFRGVSYDQLMGIGEMVKGKRDICDLPDVEMELKTFYGRPSFAEIVLEMSEEYGINVLEHVHNNTFDVGTWWRDVASKESEEVIQCWLEHAPEDKDSCVINAMFTTLEKEKQVRQCATSESIQNRIGVKRVMNDKSSSSDLDGLRIMMNDNTVYEVRYGELHEVQKKVN